MHFCGVPDGFTGIDDGGLCRWPPGHIIKVSILSYVGGIDQSVQEAIHGAAWKAWSELSGVKVDWVPGYAFANVKIRTDYLGGRSGVLARATVPRVGITGADTLFQEYDISLNWSGESFSLPGRIDLLAVATHETGHSLGLPHGPDSNIMSPIYTGSRFMGFCDDEQIVKRYGPPAGKLLGVTLVDVLRRARQLLDDILKDAKS